jgi:hypothetical protein
MDLQWILVRVLIVEGFEEVFRRNLAHPDLHRFNVKKI